MTRRGLLEAACAALVLLGASFLLQWRYGVGLSDEGLLWYVSQRTFAGELPIRDWFSYDIGRYYWSAAWFGLLGGTGLFQQLVANAVFGAIGFVAAYLTLAHAQARPWVKVVIAMTMAVILAYPRHKTYEQSLALCLVALCYAVMVDRSARTWLLFGLATGIAAMIGRNSGVYYLGAAGMAAIASRPPFGHLARYAAGVALGYLPMIALLSSDTAFRDAFIESVKGVAGWQHSLPINWPWQVDWLSRGIDATQLQAASLLVVIAPVAYASCLLAKVGKPRALAFASVFAGIPYLHHGLDRADLPHIAQGFTPFVMTAAAMLASERWRIRLAGIAAIALMWAVWLPSNPLALYRRHSSNYKSIDIQGHRFNAYDSTVDAMRSARAAFVACGGRAGSLLIAPHSPGIYAYLNTRAPFWELYYLYRRQEPMPLKHIAALERNRTAVVIWDTNATIDGRPELKLPSTYPLLVGYVTAHYTQVGGALVRREWCSGTVQESGARRPASSLHASR